MIDMMVICWRYGTCRVIACSHQYFFVRWMWGVAAEGDFSPHPFWSNNTVAKRDGSPIIENTSSQNQTGMECGETCVRCPSFSLIELQSG